MNLDTGIVHMKCKNSTLYQPMKFEVWFPSYKWRNKDKSDGKMCPDSENGYKHERYLTKEAEP